MSGAEKKAPGAGTGTGGKGEHEDRNPNINPGSIADAVTGADQNLLGPDADMIREALRYLHPEGRRMVNAKTAKGMLGHIGADLGATVQWAVEQNGTHRRNAYMAPARLRPDYTAPKKAKDVDVAGSRWLWVDLDPDKKDTGKPFAERKAGCLARLTIERPADVPAPSAIVDSGGGYWGLWWLDQEADPDTIRARLRWLADRLKGDKTTDPSRIMRLPGTVNWPDDKKRAAGQVPALAKFAIRTGVVHPLSAFGVMGGDGPKDGTVLVDLPDDLPPVSLDDLPAAVTHRTKMLIVNGDDPDDPAKYPSRSEVLFAVLCEMVRAGCTDEQMASVILDKDQGISGHVLGQPRPAQYAARQVQRARDEAFEPEMAELNMRHVVLSNEQGKTRVLEFVRTTIGGQTRNTVTLQSFDDFRNRYMNRPVVVATDKDGNPVKKPLGATWLAWPHRRQNHSLVFAPGEGDEVGEQLNLWRGFGIAPAPGDWSLMRTHIRDVLADGDPEAADYIIKWAAFAVQNPEEPAEVALVFRGKKGTGKGLFARALMRLFGQHGLHIPNGKLLTGNFNLHLRDCCLLFADEVEWHGDRQAEATLKVMVTEPELMIEGKGRDAFQSANHLHIVMSSNEEWVVPASIDERRFAAFGVSDARQGDKAYFTDLVAEMDGGGLAAMLHDLLAMDLDGWHPRWNIPQTGELMAQKLASLSGPAAVVHELLMRGETPMVERDDGRWPTIHSGDRVFIPTSDLASWAAARRLVAEVRPGLAERLGHELAKAAGPGIEPQRETVQRRQVRGWWLPALPEARRLWSASRALAVEWGEGDGAAWDVVRGTGVADDRNIPF